MSSCCGMKSSCEGPSWSKVFATSGGEGAASRDWDKGGGESANGIGDEIGAGAGAGAGELLRARIIRSTSACCVGIS